MRDSNRNAPHKAVGRAKHSNHPNTVVHTAIQFDKVFDNANRPTAVKSAGTIGKWGITSFTSIRSTKYLVSAPNKEGGSRFSSLNKKRAKAEVPLIEKPLPVTAPVISERKFFKSRNSLLSTPPKLDHQPEKNNKKSHKQKNAEQPHHRIKKRNNSQSSESNDEKPPIKLKIRNVVAPPSPPPEILTKRTRSAVQRLPTPEPVISPPRNGDSDEADKPHIVLRISRGKSETIVEKSPRSEQELDTIDEDLEEPEDEPETECDPEPECDSESELVPEPELEPELESVHVVEVEEPEKSDSEESAPLRGRVLRRRNVVRNVSTKPVKDVTRSTRQRTLRKTRNNSVCDESVVDNANTDNPNNLAIDSGYSSPPLEPAKVPQPRKKKNLKIKIKSKSRCTKKVGEQILPEIRESVEDENVAMDEDLLEAELLLASSKVDFDAISDNLLSTSNTTAVSDRDELLHLLEGSDDDSNNKVEKQTEEINAIEEYENSTQMEMEDNLPSVDCEEYVTPSNEVEDNTVEKEDEDLAIHDEEQEQAVPKILPIKKASIFKSREGKKRSVLYDYNKFKWNEADSTKVGENGVENGEEGAVKSSALFDCDDFDSPPLTKVSKVVTDKENPVISLKCDKKNKEFYTVIKNVKQAHQIQESGEFQEFNDDVEYILDALLDTNQIGTRCLSAITLATKCMEPEFRMHVRAHGTVSKFFKTLHDATKDQSLGMCTATVMFVLSQDRLNMDMDRHSLELMLNLLESDASHTTALGDCPGLSDVQLRKTRDKVKQICADIQSHGNATHLNLENITVGQLAMETLLSLTSKRAGEWFKEELRQLGGLEHIINTIVESCRHVDATANAWSPASLDKIKKLNRCLRVLENVTKDNEQNNRYILDYENGILATTLIRMCRVCDYEIPLYPTDTVADKDSTGAVLKDCLLATLRVLIHITHDYSGTPYGSAIIGAFPEIFESSLRILFQLPQHIPSEQRFELVILMLILLTNLIEYCEENKARLIEACSPGDHETVFETRSKEPAVKTLVELFYKYERLASLEEKKTDAILDGENLEKPPENAPQKVHDEFVEETLQQLVLKAGEHMQHTVLAAHVALLLAYLILNDSKYEVFVREQIPEKNFKCMVEVCQKVFNFLSLATSAANMMSTKRTQMVIKYMAECDKPKKEERMED